MIKEIQLVDCRKLTGKSLVVIAASCPSIEKIDLRGIPLIDNLALDALASNCRQLEMVDLSANLDSAGKSLRSHIPRVGPDGLYAIGKHSSRLKILMCNGVTRIDDTCIMSLARGCTSLEVLAIKKCY